MLGSGFVPAAQKPTSINFGVNFHSFARVPNKMGRRDAMRKHQEGKKTEQLSGRVCTVNRTRFEEGSNNATYNCATSTILVCAIGPIIINCATGTILVCAIGPIIIVPVA